MFTNCVIVGRVKEIPVVETSSKGTVYAHIMLESERSYPNVDGTYTTDVFNVTLWRGIAEECAASCQIGSVIAVKGRLESHSYLKDNKTMWFTDVIAEKVRILMR